MSDDLRDKTIERQTHRETKGDKSDNEHRKATTTTVEKRQDYKVEEKWRH